MKKVKSKKAKKKLKKAKAKTREQRLREKSAFAESFQCQEDLDRTA